jgi:hypothetical protein
MNILLPKHLLLNNYSSPLHGHFTVHYGVFMPQHRQRPYLDHPLVIVAFPDNIIIPAVWPEGKIVTIDPVLSPWGGSLLLCHSIKQRTANQETE